MTAAYEPSSQCAGKIPFTRRAAEESVRLQARRRNNRVGRDRRRKALNAYRCPHCGHWHVGHTR